MNKYQLSIHSSQMPQAFQTYGCKLGDFLCDVHVTEAFASALGYSAGCFWETLSTHAHCAQHPPLTVFWFALNHVCQLVKRSNSSGYGICPMIHVARRMGRSGLKYGQCPVLKIRHSWARDPSQSPTNSARTFSPEPFLHQTKWE